MSVAVLIPWRRTDCPYRSRALAWVVAKLEADGWAVVMGEHNDGPWCKARAVAAALQQTDSEVLVIHDADVWCDGLRAAVAAVEAGAAWSVPHRGVFRLDEPGTVRLMAGEPLEALPLAERAYLGVEGGGIAVVRREIYEDCPLDARFVGWGGEDEAAGFMWRCLHGPPWRGKTPLAHCFHPSQQRACRSFGSMEGRDLRKRYARARNDADAMKRLIWEVDAQCH